MQLTTNFSQLLILVSVYIKDMINLNPIPNELTKNVRHCNFLSPVASYDENTMLKIDVYIQQNIVESTLNTYRSIHEPFGSVHHRQHESVTYWPKVYHLCCFSEFNETTGWQLFLAWNHVTLISLSMIRFRVCLGALHRILSGRIAKCVICSPPSYQQVENRVKTRAPLNSRNLKFYATKFLDTATFMNSSSGAELLDLIILFW